MKFWYYKQVHSSRLIIVRKKTFLKFLFKNNLNLVTNWTLKTFTEGWHFKTKIGWKEKGEKTCWSVTRCNFCIIINSTHSRLLRSCRPWKKISVQSFIYVVFPNLLALSYYTRTSHNAFFKSTYHRLGSNDQKCLEFLPQYY